MACVVRSFVTPKERKGFGQMSDEEKASLDAIGFPFEMPDDMKGAWTVDLSGEMALQVSSFLFVLRWETHTCRLTTLPIVPGSTCR